MNIPPKCTRLQELNSLDALPLSQIRAIRVGYLLQKEINITPTNVLLKEYLFKNNFAGGKNALHYQTLGDSYSVYKKNRNMNSGKRVSFQ